MKVLVTGGAGYIGSTIVSACSDNGYIPVVLDDLSTGRRENIEGHHFYAGDVADTLLIHRIFAEHPEIAVVIHCAARAIVAESIRAPAAYYDVNVARTLALVAALESVNCRRLVFASSASIYDADATRGPDPVGGADETCAVDPTSPYGRSKLMCEWLLEDIAHSSTLRVVALRYVTPLGADPLLRSGLQPDAPWRVLGALMGCARDGTPFTVLGRDWPTRDGTPLRDYLHVWDLAAAHVAVLDRFDDVISAEDPFLVLNVSSGRAATVLELVSAFEQAAGVSIPLAWGEPRPGDTVGYVVNSDRITALLDWRATRTLEQSLADSLRWRATTSCVTEAASRT